MFSVLDLVVHDTQCDNTSFICRRRPFFPKPKLVTFKDITRRFRGLETICGWERRWKTTDVDRTEGVVLIAMKAWCWSRWKRSSKSYPKVMIAPLRSKAQWQPLSPVLGVKATQTNYRMASCLLQQGMRHISLLFTTFAAKLQVMSGKSFPIRICEDHIKPEDNKYNLIRAFLCVITTCGCSQVEEAILGTS